MGPDADGVDVVAAGRLTGRSMRSSQWPAVIAPPPSPICTLSTKKNSVASTGCWSRNRIRVLLAMKAVMS